jgi:membrane dipeptidase
VRFFDAHCDTIGKIWEGKADFAADGGSPGADLHVTLPGLRTAGVCAQVFASWAWSEMYKGREQEAGLAKVEAVRQLCDRYPADLFLALTGAEIAEACQGSGPGGPGALAAPGRRDDSGGQRARIAVVASLEGANPLLGDVDNLALFYDAGVRLLTLAWGDNAFLGSVFGNGGGLARKGADLVEACEERRVLVDVSHASDDAFRDICQVATRPFVASHSNCRSLCPSPRNLTDEMIRAVAERGGVVCATLAPGFLSTGFLEEERPISEAFFRAVAAGTETVEEAGRRSAAATAQIPRPPLGLIVDQVLRAINVGGEDAVGLGGDLDGIDALPAGLDGVAGYPRIAELLAKAGLGQAQLEKVCHGNLARLFQEVLE